MNPTISKLIEFNEATIEELNNLLINSHQEISDFKDTRS